MANEVVQTFGDKLNDSLILAQKALPKDFNRERFIQNALSVCNGNADLQKCSKSSLIEGLMKGAFLGLDFCMKECYLIPYGNTATFQTDYKGEIKFVKKYSIRPIKDIYAELVRKDDEFERWIEADGTQHFTFKQKMGNSDIVGAFAVCQFADGGLQIEVMSIEDIQSVRNAYSKQSQGKTWKSSFGEMSKKVVLRRLCKHINTSFESIEAQQAWEDGSGMDFTNGSAVDHSDIAQPFGKKEESEEEIIEAEATIVDVPEVEGFK